MEVLATGPAIATVVPRKKEKRKSKRDPVSGSLAILWGTNAQDERISRASIVDLSSHGAKFRMPERIPPGSWLMFNYHQMGASGRGTVRYCQLVRGSYHIGVEFSGGTGWNPNANRFASELRSLSLAVDSLQTADLPEAQ
jgi:PilZ domain